MTTKAIRLALCAAAMGAATANAEDYTVPAGTSETMTLSGGVTTTYDAVTVAGDLTVTGDGWVQPTRLNLAGGTLTVDGAKASFGRVENSGVNTSNVVTFADGAYGKVVVTNGTGTGNINSTSDRYNFSARYFDVVADANATGDGGYIDVLSIATGGVDIREFRNYSTLTARVSVAGTAYMTKGNGYSSAGIFQKGPTAIVLQDGADLTVFNAGQLGSLNAANVPVTVAGDGDLTLYCIFTTSYYDNPMCVRKGALIDNAGNLTLRGGTGAGGGIFQFYDGVIGPNVTKVSTTGGRVILRVAADSAVTVKDLDLVRANYADCLAGDAATSVVRIDATDAPRTFRANMPPQYSYTASNATQTRDNFITVEKVGGHEATISATTNIPSLKVLEGAVRITSDCAVSNLSVAAGATLVADGCAVTLLSDAEFVGASLVSENGGRFVKSGVSSRAVIYDPVAVTGLLHVASGSLVFSKYGFSQKHWRWTFTKVAGGPGPLLLGRLWIFGTDGESVTPNSSGTTSSMSYKAPNSVLSAPGTVCFVHDSSTNVANKANASSWQTTTQLNKCFRTDFESLNNFPNLISPEIDPGNPASHLGVELYLNASAKPVTGYNIMTQSKTVYPVSWKVEASEDGVEWTTVETRTDEVHGNPGMYYYFDGEYAEKDKGVSPVQQRGKPREHFHFTGYRHDGLSPLAEPLALQVDAGAEIDLRAFTGGQAIGALTIDLAAGGGTIHGGALAAGGTLTLVNAAGHDLSQTLPLIFDGTADLANAKTWSVVIDGKVKKYKVAAENGVLRLIPPGMTIVIR